MKKDLDFSSSYTAGQKFCILNETFILKNKILLIYCSSAILFFNFTAKHVTISTCKIWEAFWVLQRIY